MSYRRQLGHGIGILLAALYTCAGQAHFTSRLTPDLAAQIELMTQNSYRAFWFLNLTYPQLKHTFGVFDLIGAALLCRPSTRRAGLWMSVVGFEGGLYGQWTTGGGLGQVTVMLAMAVIGLVALR